MTDSKIKIVITSINPPTGAIKGFAGVAPSQVIVVADKKTPEDWIVEGVKFLAIKEQDSLAGGRFTDLLPFNHYCRKMMGYLYAIQSGAETIIDSDDDNIPKHSWSGPPPFNGKHLCSPPELGFVNVYSWFTGQYIWPRGFPIRLVQSETTALAASQLTESEVEVGVWQGLADKDPDVDAIYRMVVNAPCVFEDKPPIVLNTGTVAPFNSQNTTFRTETFPLLYLPSFVSFRFTDILRGLIAQPILWAHGLRLGFMGASVIQERNYHNLLDDFESEIPCYLLSERIIDVVRGSIRSNQRIDDDLFEAYRALHANSIVVKQELELLEAWLGELERHKR